MFQNGSACFRLHVGPKAGERLQREGGKREGGRGREGDTLLLLVAVDAAQSSQKTLGNNDQNAFICSWFIGITRDQTRQAQLGQLCLID